MKKQQPLFIRLYLPFLFVILGALLFSASYAYFLFQRHYKNQVANDLKIRTTVLARWIEPLLDGQKLDSLQALAQKTGREIGTRFTVILPNGEVIADSEENPKNMENHRTRPEIKKALQGETGISFRFSRTVKKNLMYVAIPLQKNQEIKAVVRGAIPIVLLSSTLHQLIIRLGLLSAVMACVLALVAYGVYRGIANPIRAINKGVTAFTQGDLEHRIFVENPIELSALANALNAMASKLNADIHTILYQKNEIETILSTMTEGILVVDTNDRILRINPSAEKFLGCPFHEAQNRNIQEVLRIKELLDFTQKALANDTPSEGEITVFSTPEPKFFRAYGAPLKNGEGKKIGVLIVLNDHTKIRKLENLRKEFVANVSHELKTPLTTIQGFLETLKEGAILEPENAKKFLGIIERHTQRLNAIIDDLLTLSRLEQCTEEETIPKTEISLQKPIQEAIALCQAKAEEKKITIEVQCPAEIKARIHEALLAQAIANLIDNAIKFSAPESKVKVECGKEEKNVYIRVQDWGCGIEEKHIPRLFERFYRVDKGRSRQLGGTGLGLSIVKHIVHAHKGEVKVQSKVNQGSTFTIVLPEE